MKGRAGGGCGGVGGSPSCGCSCSRRWLVVRLQKAAVMVVGTLLLVLVCAQLLSTSTCRLLSSASTPQEHWTAHALSTTMTKGEEVVTNLVEMESAWNEVALGVLPAVALPKLRIAAFVRKWPSGAAPGGLERHALTLYRFLADRGHEVHVFTAGNGNGSNIGNSRLLHVHRCAGAYSASSAWASFQLLNASSRFHILHTESVALPHTLAAGLSNVVASWHGIAFEVVHSDIVSELLRPANASRPVLLQRTLAERLLKVSDEVRFFGSYKHHVAISDHVGEVLRTVYQLPGERVHVILNGVDDGRFRPAPEKGAAFRRAVGLNGTALVLGVAGRLVKDKGHPLLVEALQQEGLLEVRRGGGACAAQVVVAGEGPWAARYREMACVIVVGAIGVDEMAGFYNGIDVFVNPTLRAQGLDLTLLEAMMCGKPVVATRFASITRSVVVAPSLGYTFSPNTASLRAVLRRVLADGRSVLTAKGTAARQRASRLFTAAHMGLAYERLFLCLTRPRFCRHPLPPLPFFSSTSS